MSRLYDAPLGAFSAPAEGSREGSRKKNRGLSVRLRRRAWSKWFHPRHPSSPADADQFASRRIPLVCPARRGPRAAERATGLQMWGCSWQPARAYRCRMETTTSAAGGCADADAKLRANFLQVLRSRRTAEVNLLVEKAKPITNPMYQGTTGSREAMESCPKEDIKDFKERLIEENLMLITETGEQGRLPVLILSLKENKQDRRPAIVFLHSSYKTKEWVRPLLEAYASRGYITVAVDSRYHGERAKNVTTYRDALVSAWKNGDTMPFLFDTVWDLIKLGDYLSQREDIDPARIGITGESLGEARKDLGKNAIDKEVVGKVWDRIAPGLASEFDSPYTIPAIAPRPLLILNGAEDPRCPLAGLDTPVSKADEAYREACVPENLKFIAEPGIGHQMTSSMVKATAFNFSDRRQKMAIEKVCMWFSFPSDMSKELPAACPIISLNFERQQLGM